MADSTWRALDLSGVRDRLIEVKSLLEQAAALGAAQDAARVEAIAEVHQQRSEVPRAHARRRRYR